MIHRFVRFVELALQTLFDHVANENRMGFVAHFEDILAGHMTEAEHRRLEIVDRLERRIEERTCVESVGRTCRMSPCAVKMIASRPSEVKETCSTLEISISRLSNCSSFSLE